jgi:hypothetical protein
MVCLLVQHDLACSDTNFIAPSSLLYFVEFTGNFLPPSFYQDVKQDYWLLVPLLVGCGRCPPGYGNNDVHLLSIYSHLRARNSTNIVPKYLTRHCKLHRLSQNNFLMCTHYFRCDTPQTVCQCCRQEQSPKSGTHNGMKQAPICTMLPLLHHTTAS